MESKDPKALQRPSLYTDFQICGSLNPNLKCFRLRKYNQGEFDDLFHEHVDKHRISEDNAVNFLKLLVAKYSKLNDSDILQSYLNKRGEKLTSMLRFHIDYPEPGVIRRNCIMGDIVAWMDEVIQEKEFRPLDQRHE